MMEYIPKKIIVDAKVRDSSLTYNVLQNLPLVPVEYIEDTISLIDRIKGGEETSFASKRTLLLTENKGRFIKPCPGTKEYICCGYEILNFGTNCNIECSYCILQAYLNTPFMVMFANIDDMFAELEEQLEGTSKPLHRLGTGEFTDSLTLDHLTGFTKSIVEYIGKKENAILELKTKTKNIGNLLDLQHNGKVIVSWSLNSKEMAKKEEGLAASIDERIEAAERCQEFGYRVGFHFDPLLYYPGWEQGYKETLERLFKRIDPSNVAWISMGCFRFMPELKPIMQKRFPSSRIVYEEFIPGMDGKMRYFKPLRIEMYSKMLQWIKNYSSTLRVYLCMESPEVWRKVFKNDTVKNSEELTAMLEMKNE